MTRLIYIVVGLALTTRLGAISSYPVVPAFNGITFRSPVQIVFAPGEISRAFVVELPGIVSVINNVDTPTRTVVLDLSARVNQGTPDHGLLALAFHPKFSTNGYFYLWTSIWESGARYMRLLRFTMAANGSIDPTTEATLISQSVGTGGHDGGTLFFGADNYLYLSLGDGDEGSAGAEAIASHQRIDRGFFGGVVRLDVDQAPGNLAPNPHAGQVISGYRIPADNPYIGATSFNNLIVNPGEVRTEFWAVGLRNPFRMSLDSVTGEIWCGDVGLDLREEIDIISRAGNYGWSFLEGSAPGPLAAQTPAGVRFVAPVWEYGHGAGDICVTGGLVYRGTRFPELQGNYIYSDYLSGRIWVATNIASRPFTADRILPIGAQTGIVGFTSQPGKGDILFANHDKGIIQRLGDPAAGAIAPAIVAQPRSGMVASGGSLALTVGATGPGLTYQWFYNFSPVSGATAATYYIANAGASSAGSYSCQVSNAFGLLASASAKVSVTSGSDLRRLIAISTRGLVGTGDNLMVAGFVLSGSVSKTVLVRASGPALTQFLSSGTLPDPVLRLYDSAGNLVSSNQGWGGNSAIASVAASVGLFAWPNSASLDSALLVTLPPGGYTAQISSASGITGTALVEVYDIP